MADNTKIEWTDATWNVITGCSVVSPGCTNCYAMRLAGSRLKHHESRKGLTRPSKAGPVWTGEVRFNEQWLTQPLTWKRPRRIFVAAHGGLFADGVKDEWLDRIFAVMALCPQHTFQVLTKRPERMREYMRRQNPKHIHPSMNHVAAIGETGPRPPALDLRNWPLPNVWLGVSVEDQARADERIPLLLDTPAALRWISAEPLLGPLNLEPWLDWPSPLIEMPNGDAWGCIECEAQPCTNCPDRKAVHVCHVGPKDRDGAPQYVIDERRLIDWIVAGGESGPDARPMHPDWVRALRDQCAAAGVPFNFKQWGAYRPCEWKLERWPFEPDDEYKQRSDELCSRLAFSRSGHVTTLDHAPWSAERALEPPTSHQAIKKVGKSAAGRLLDGVLHDAFPEARP